MDLKDEIGKAVDEVRVASDERSRAIEELRRMVAEHEAAARALVVAINRLER